MLCCVGPHPARVQQLLVLHADKEEDVNVLLPENMMMPGKEQNMLFHSAMQVVLQNESAPVQGRCQPIHPRCMTGWFAAAQGGTKMVSSQG